MKSYKQFLEEGVKSKILSGLAAAGVAAGIGSIGNKFVKPSASARPQMVSKVEQPAPPTPVQTAPQAKKSNSLEQFHAGLRKKHGNEYDTIMDAALNNGIKSTDVENLSILFSIRKAENGPKGTEFGVLHNKAKGTNLRTQAGWAAATIMNNRGRHDAKKHGDFISFLGSRYAPQGVSNDPKNLNKNWIKNVTTHYNENMGFNQSSDDKS